MPSTPRQAGVRPAARRRRAVPLALLAACLLATLIGLAYLAARETSLFAVRSFEVSGAQPAVTDEVRQALEPLLGTSLVSLSPSDVEERIEALPTVRSARVDRRFPHAVSIAVTQERPVAVARQGDESWLVASSGRVLAELAIGEFGRLPRVWLEYDTPPLVIGATVDAAQGAGAIRAVALLPPGFPARVQSVRGSEDDLLLVLGGRLELRLGPAVDVRQKLAAAAVVLEDVQRERVPLAYLDVSLPERPVGAPESQVEGRA